MPVRSLRIAAVALVLAAGAAAPVNAAATGTLASTQANGLTTLTLDGAAIRTTQASIVNPRLIPLTRSKKVIALWDEVSAAGTQHYYALSLNGQTFDQVLPTTYNVRLAYATFDPKVAHPAIPAALKANDASRVYLVQFVIPPIDEFRRDIAAMGGTVNTFLTDHTHVVTMDAATAGNVAALPYVRWVGQYHPAYRLSRDIRGELMAAMP